MSNPKLPFPHRRTDFPIDTLRGSAILLVVLYHVIGSSPDVGLRLGPYNGWRHLADLLNEIHMPVFALLAGLVYGMVPVAPGGMGRFLRDKLRRLAVPGLVAIMVFVLASQLVTTQVGDMPPVWLVAVLPFLHFWFLQAILVVLVGLAVLDRLTGTAGLWIALAAGLMLLATGLRPATAFMSLNGAAWLWPYAVAGVLIWRERDGLRRRRLIWGGMAVALALAGLAGWATNGDIVGHEHGAPWQLALAFGVTVAGLCLVPDLRVLAWLGPPSFAIYLYHPLFTSGARRVLQGAGWPVTQDTLPLHLMAGVGLGVAGPLVLYVAAMRHGGTRRVLLGLRR